MKIHPSLFELCCSQTDKQTNKRRWKHYTADQWNEVLTYLHQSHPASAQWTCNERKDHLCPAVFQEAKNKRPRLGHATQKGRQRAGKADNPANEWQKSTATSASKPTKLAESRKALNKPHTNTHTHTQTYGDKETRIPMVLLAQGPQSCHFYHNHTVINYQETKLQKCRQLRDTQLNRKLSTKWPNFCL